MNQQHDPSFERARSRAVTWLHHAQDSETATKDELAKTTRATASAIVDARIIGMPWTLITTALGIGRSAANTRLKKAGLKPPAVANKRPELFDHHHDRLESCLKAEDQARKHLEEATDVTAATIIIARTLGHTWDTVAEATGITRKNQIARLNKAHNTDGLHVPDAAKTAEYSQSEHDSILDDLSGQAAILWPQKVVFEHVGFGVRTAVTNTLAAHLNRPGGEHPTTPQLLVKELTACHHKAVKAAVKAVATLNLAGLDPHGMEAVEAAAHQANIAATQAGNTPDGGHDRYATVFRPTDGKEIASKLSAS